MAWELEMLLMWRGRREVAPCLLTEEIVVLARKASLLTNDTKSGCLD